MVELQCQDWATPQSQLDVDDEHEDVALGESEVPLAHLSGSELGCLRSPEVVGVRR